MMCVALIVHAFTVRFNYLQFPHFVTFNFSSIALWAILGFFYFSAQVLTAMQRLCPNYKQDSVLTGQSAEILYWTSRQRSCFTCPQKKSHVLINSKHMLWREKWNRDRITDLLSFLILTDICGVHSIEHLIVKCPHILMVWFSLFSIWLSLYCFNAYELSCFNNLQNMMTELFETGSSVLRVFFDL